MVKKSKPSPLLSIIIPAYNEVTTIQQVVAAVKKCGVRDHEIIVVDDGSTDGTRKKLAQLKNQIDQCILRPTNGGKGAALRDGIAAAQGNIVVIQDADLEYNPQDLKELIQPIVDGQADVVFGSRFISGKPHRVVYFWHYLANMGLTTLSNMFNNLNLTDMETGYKAFRRDLLQSIELTENAFGIEPELTAKVAARRARIYEVGIAYHGRTYDEGKKIGFKDLIRAIYVIISLGLLNLVTSPNPYRPS